MTPKVGDVVRICYAGNFANNVLGEVVEIAIGGFRNAEYAKILTEKKGVLSYYLDDLQVIQLVGPHHGDKSR